jgi:hypothetical protein
MTEAMKTWAGKLGRCTVAAVVAGLLLPVVASAAITHTITAEADSYVRSSSEKKSFGFEHQVELRMGSSGATEGYVQFLLPPHAPYADKVVLRLFAQQAEPGVTKALVRSVAPVKWTELELSWQTRPEHRETIGSFEVVGLSGAWYEVDVTAYVKSEARAGQASVTMALVPGAESKNRTIIHSRENATKKPELVISRQPLTAKVSFLPATANPPAGYLADHGAVFGAHTNGFAYGWSEDMRGQVRDRNEGRYKKDKNPNLKTPDRRYDFIAYMDNDKLKAPATWEIALPNGTYKVRMVAGDATKYDSIYGLTAEQTAVVNGVPDTGRRWIEGTATVTLTDGRLTVGHTPIASNNKLCFIEITEVENLLAKQP